MIKAENDMLPKLGSVRYQMLGDVGGGTFGEIRIAYDTVIRRKVALKILKPQHLRNPQFMQRFVHEYQTLARLEHPNIVAIYDAGTLKGGGPFFSMRYVGGTTLESSVKNFHDSVTNSKPLDFCSAEFLGLLRCFIETCRAIGFAHRNKVVHRDLKPNNILISESGETFVIDWGTAKWIDQATEDGKDPASLDQQGSQNLQTINRAMGTIQGAILGTPAFMSPEQAIGDIHSITERSDVYSLGAILFYLLTRRAPNDGTNLNDILGSALKGDGIDPREFVAGAPTRLAEICIQAMQPDPSNRYASADAIADEASAWVNALSVADEIKQSAPAPRITSPDVSGDSEESFAWPRWQRIAILVLMAISTVLVAAVFVMLAWKNVLT